MNINFKIPLTNYVFSFVSSKTNPFWFRIYYKYQLKDAVVGILGEIPNSDFQALGLDFDDELTLEELKTHVDNYICFVQGKYGVDLGRAWIFETSPSKYYVWFFESRLNYRCKCPTIINLAGIENLQADPNYLMWLQKKKSCVMRISKKKFYQKKPKLVAVVGEKKPIPLDQEYWYERIMEMM
jgi:hypothetical protein